MKYDPKKCVRISKLKKDRYDSNFFQHLVSYKEYQLSYFNGVKRLTLNIYIERSYVHLNVLQP